MGTLQVALLNGSYNDMTMTEKFRRDSTLRSIRLR